MDVFKHCFEKLTDEDVRVMKEYFDGFDYQGASYTFLANYIWRTTYCLCWERISDYLCLAGADCMYHKVYDAKNPPKDIDTNCISNANLESQLKYLVKEGYYFPTWQEVRDYVDGKIDLPEKSCVLTFDDGTISFMKYGVPLIEKYDVRATAFIIVSKNGKLWTSKHYKHVNLQSHSYNMHRPGGKIGHGGVFTALSYKAGLADLNKSTKILGSHEAFAYPFGDYTKRCEKAVKAAGFLVAFTTENAKVHPGDDPYLLTRVRINGDISMGSYCYHSHRDLGDKLYPKGETSA